MSDAYSGSYEPLKFNFFDKVFNRNVFFDKSYNYSFLSSILWTITDESKEIAGYNCIKAVGKLEDVIKKNKTYNVEAWFSPEVPYPIGPDVFVGLPGVIVYLVYENYFIYKLESIKFNENTLDINSIKFEGEPMKKEQYIEYLKS